MTEEAWLWGGLWQAELSGPKGAIRLPKSPESGLEKLRHL